jgi:hypothetical protein
MTLAEHFIDPQPLEGRVLVFSEELKNTLLSIQEANPLPYRVSPQPITDGRYVLSADVLSEIGERGMFRENFQRLPQELFAQVEMVLMSEIEALLPEDHEGGG